MYLKSLLFVFLGGLLLGNPAFAGNGVSFEYRTTATMGIIFMQLALCLVYPATIAKSTSAVDTLAAGTLGAFFAFLITAVTAVAGVGVYNSNLAMTCAFVAVFASLASVVTGLIAYFSGITDRLLALMFGTGIIHVTALVISIVK